MSVSNGENADQNTFNSSFMSKEVDSQTIAKVDLNRTGSGDQIPDAQQQINDNKDDIADHETRITDNESDISTLQSDSTLNNSHRLGDGSDHANVALNDTHRASDGKDHSDVVLNNAHRVSTSNPHSVTASQVGNTTAQWNANEIQGVDVHTTAPTDGQVLKYVAANSRYEAQDESGGGGGISGYAYLSETQTSGTNGGSSSANTVHTRVLNTEFDPDGIVTLSSNQFTLGEGKYIIRGRAPSRESGNEQLFIYNTSDSTYDLEGPSHTNSVVTQTYSFVEGLLDLAGSKTFELRHWITAARANIGLGVAANGTNNPQTQEIYSTVEIIKIG